MKKIIFLITVSLFSINSFGQDYSQLKNVKLENAEDYKKAELKVLECANYLLANPVDKDELNRLNSFQFLFKWMEGTSDYTFSIGSEAMDLTKGKTELLTMYFTSMTKTVLENADAELTDEEIQKQSIIYLNEYCLNPANNLKATKKMKKMMKVSKP